MNGRRPVTMLKYHLLTVSVMKSPFIQGSTYDVDYVAQRLRYLRLVKRMIFAGNVEVEEE